MNARERILAILAGTLVALFLVGLVGWRISQAFTRRYKSIEAAEKLVAAKTGQLAKIEAAALRIDAYRERSLPVDRKSGPNLIGNVNLARSLYQQWLLRQIDAESGVGLAEANVSATPGRHRAGVYFELTFTVTGSGTLEQVTRLMHRLFAIDQLHRIRRMQIKPISESKQLDVSYTIDALVVAGAAPGSGLRNGSATTIGPIEAYLDPILSRNLFGPPNNGPSLAYIANQTGNPGKPVSFAAKAADEDQLDRVTYRLGGTAPSEASIDASSGDFRWTPDELGTYRVEVEAIDDGLPPKVAARSVEIRIVESPPPAEVADRDPEPPKLGFDDARHAFVTAIMQVDTRPQIWIHVRATGEQFRLHEGDAVEVGSVKGTIGRIGERTAEIVTDDGRIVVGLGESLLEATKLPADGI